MRVINWSAFVWFEITKCIYRFLSSLRGMYLGAYRSANKKERKMLAAYYRWRTRHWDRRMMYWVDLCETYREKAYGL